MSMSFARNVILIAVGCTLAGCQKQATTEAVPSEKPSVAPTVSIASLRTPPPKVHNGPFGLASGMPVAELTALGFKPVEGHPGLFRGSVPKPIDGANEYIVLATTETGVCRINARANVPVVNGSGDQVKAKVDQLAEIMAVKYGKHSTKETYISQDVYRRNQQYWMMGLQEDSVLYGYLWEAGKTALPLPQDMKAIEITAGASSAEAAWASIQYTFNNFDACLKENQKLKASNL